MPLLQVSSEHRLEQGRRLLEIADDHVPDRCGGRERQRGNPTVGVGFDVDSIPVPRLGLGHVEQLGDGSPEEPDPLRWLQFAELG
jgi:hypothetical protein